MVLTPQMQQAFSELESRLGLPAGYLANAARIESNNGDAPDRPGSQFNGMFQLGKDVRSTYNVTDPNNWQENARGAAEYARDNYKILTNQLGRAPTADELYLAHNQGAGGASSLLLHPDAAAGSLVKPLHVSANAGDPNAPSSQFVDMIRSKYNQNNGPMNLVTNAPPGATGALAPSGGLASGPTVGPVPAAPADPNAPPAPDKPAETPVDQALADIQKRQQQVPAAELPTNLVPQFGQSPDLLGAMQNRIANSMGGMRMRGLRGPLG